MKATVTEHLKRGRITALSAKHRGKRKRNTKIVLIATKSVSLPAGRTVNLRLSLNGTGAKLLKSYRTLHALLTISSAGKTVHTQKVTITAPTAKRTHK